MPSIQQEWRFNFEKELKKLPGASGYLLVTEETPDVIEGCMIFMLNKQVAPYMAKRLDGTTMVIMDEDGESLVREYLSGEKK